MKNLVDATKSEQLKFIESFDHVLADLDGVLWLYYKPIPGSVDCLESLKGLGKKIHYVSNNSLAPREAVRGKLEAVGLSADVEDIALPITAIVSYLKKINFNKVLYVIGMSVVKETLKSVGISIVEGPQQVPETIRGVLDNIKDDENIGGVLVEFDANVNYIKLQKAIAYLMRKDCLFIAAAADAKLPMGHVTPLLGPYHFLRAIIDASGREPYQIAKPDVNYNEFIKENFKITDPTRVLFIGDSVSEDMNFATKCGYQKLLVLSGITKKEHLTNWEHPEEYKPQYYVESLNNFYEVIQSCTSNNK